MVDRFNRYSHRKYTRMISVIGCLGLSGCLQFGEVDGDESDIGTSTHAVGVDDDCPAGTSYDFTYGNAKMLFCSHKDILVTDSDVTRALVVIRGSSWASFGYERYYENTHDEAVAAGMDLDKLDIIAPRLLRDSTCDGNSQCSRYGSACISDSDCQPAGYYRWSSSYVGGGQDATGNGVSSYEVLDALLFTIASTRPNLEMIVVAGQSQGAQFVNHYAPSSILSSGSSVTLRYWSANAGGYPWLNDDPRPDPVAAAQCSTGANNWPYGLDSLYQYHLDRNYDATDLIDHLVSRDIYWTVGENDNDPAGYKATQYCGNSQGQYRLDRMRNYKDHTYDECIDQGYQHCTSFRDEQFLEIPGAGHGMSHSWQSAIGHKMLFDTVHANCSDSAVDHEILDDGGISMVGCAGSVSYADRDTLCASGFEACTASEWVNHRDTQLTPDYNYWTDDALKYGAGGSSGNCWVDETDGNSCPSVSPMRVCTGDSSGTDSLGNTCNWDNCGYDGSTQNEYFGGCFGNTTAGTLCCPSP